MATALVLGATGLVGGHLLERLLASDGYARVACVGRRGPSQVHGKLTFHAVDLDRIDTLGDALAVDDVFCCLGTTIRVAGSEAAFRRVDFDFPVAAAKATRAHGARHFLLVSSLGADPRSRVFYNRVKGETEAAVGSVDFPALSIFRPSLLTGRPRKARPAEHAVISVVQALAPLLRGPLAGFRPSAAADVASAMVKVALQAPVGRRIYAAEDIRRLA